MSVFARGPRREEQPGVGAGLEVDLELRVCPQCRRELHPWQETCPDDGAQGVAPTALRAADLPEIPPELRDDAD